MRQLPAFVAFTGIDRIDIIDDLKQLSRRYPIEWGVLVDDAQSSLALFPDSQVRQAFLTAGGLRLAAHVCGDDARKIANTSEGPVTDLTGYQRVQVNHSFEGSTQEQIETTIRFGRRIGARAMLQCKGDFPADCRLDWLFDVSFGTGVSPKTWPSLTNGGPFCGYSGGIKPANVVDVLNAIDAASGTQYWIDMESGVRTDGWLDLNKCEDVCRAVFG
mgnify:CR=1 FL=1